MNFSGVPYNIALLNGPMVLGYLFSYGLFGILVAQAYIYHTHFPTDGLGVRVLVWTVMLIELLITVLITHAAFVTLGSGWGDFTALIHPVWSLMATPTLSGLVSSIVHSFFCWRIWVLGRVWPLCVFIMLLSLIQWGMACYVGIKLSLLGDMRLIHDVRMEIIVWTAGSALADTIIAISMVFFLFRANTKTSFHTTNSAISRLIKVTVETGFITACDAICDLLFFVASPDTNIHFIFYFMLAKLYSNSLLATLNSRISSRIATQISRGNVALWDGECQGSSGVVSTGRVPSKMTTNGGRGVHITTVTEHHSDSVQMLSFSQPTDGDVYHPKTETDSKTSQAESA